MFVWYPIAYERFKCPSVYVLIGLKTRLGIVREICVDIEIDSLTLWVERKSFGKLGV